MASYIHKNALQSNEHKSVYSFLNYKTWLLIGISFLALLVMLSALALLVRYKRGNRPPFKTILETVNAKGMYIIGIITNHGKSFKFLKQHG